MLALVFLQRVPDRLVGQAELLADLLDDLVARQRTLTRKRAGLADHLLALLARPPAEVFGLSHQFGVLLDEPVDRRFEEPEAAPAVVEDELPGQQPAPPPAADRLGRNVEPLGQLLDRVDLLRLQVDRLGQLAAELGDEQLQVGADRLAVEQFAVELVLGVVAGDVEADEIERVLLRLVDQGVELLGRGQFVAPLLLRREPQLHEQLGQFGILDLSHITECLL